MTQLLKYELQRRRTLLPGAVIAMVFMEGIALYGIYRGGGWNTLALVITVLLLAGGLLLPILDTVTKLYADYKQKQGYMLFLTPRSGYRILWAKALFGALEIVAVSALLCGFLALSAAALDHFQQGAATAIFQSMSAELNNLPISGMLFIYGGLMVLEMFAQMAIAMLAVTVSRVMVQGNRYNWLVALAMYFALAIGVNMVNSLLLVAFGLIGDMELLMGSTAFIGQVLAKYFIIGACTYVVWAATCTAVAGRLASRNIDL